MPEIVSEIVELSVFSRCNKTARYLLLRRAKKKKPYPGIWQFITGRIEKGENSLEAVLRELNEETGLAPKAIWFVPYILHFYDPSTDKLHISPLFAAEVDYKDKIRLSGEHDKFAWFSHREATNRLAWPAQRDGLKIINKFIVSQKKVSRLTRLS